jgi:hypothetical protein
LPEYLLDAEKVAAKRRAHELGIKQAKFQELPDNVLYLQELEHDGILYTTPSQDYDDSYQIEYARRHGGVIVTNDLFRTITPCRNTKLCSFLSYYLLTTF